MSVGSGDANTGDGGGRDDGVKADVGERIRGGSDSESDLQSGPAKSAWKLPVHRPPAADHLLRNLSVPVADWITRRLSGVTFNPAQASSTYPAPHPYIRSTWYKHEEALWPRNKYPVPSTAYHGIGLYSVPSTP